MTFSEAKTKTLCLAHRGGSWDHLENSLGAIKWALNQNVDGIEIDLRQTKDGHAILLHDENLSQVAKGIDCPLDINVADILYSEILKKCKLTDDENVATLDEVFNLIRENDVYVNLDLKVRLNDLSIKKILESGISMKRFRITAFQSEILEPIFSSMILTEKQRSDWNSIPRYENFRYPYVFAIKNRKNFHLFSALAYGQLNSEDRYFGAWEVNYPIFLSWVLNTNPEFIVTKNPKECLQIRDSNL